MGTHILEDLGTHKMVPVNPPKKGVSWVLGVYIIHGSHGFGAKKKTSKNPEPEIHQFPMIRSPQ